MIIIIFSIFLYSSFRLLSGSDWGALRESKTNEGTLNWGKGKFGMMIKWKS